MANRYRFLSFAELLDVTDLKDSDEGNQAGTRTNRPILGNCQPSLATAYWAKSMLSNAQGLKKFQSRT